MDYIQFGAGKEVLAILPGLSVQSVMSAADAIAEAYQTLTDDFTIYLFDRRKHVPSSYTIEAMAADTLTAFEQLGLERVSLFGASQGGMIALQIAIERPQLVQKLVVSSTSACITEEHYRLFDPLIELARRKASADLYVTFGEYLYPPELLEQSKALLLDAAQTVSDDDLERFIALTQGMKDFNILDALEEITCPILVIGAANDRIFGMKTSIQIAHKLADRQDFELVIYGGYGHAVYDLAPDFKERMLRFLT